MIFTPDIVFGEDADITWKAREAVSTLVNNSSDSFAGEVELSKANSELIYVYNKGLKDLVEMGDTLPKDEEKFFANYGLISSDLLGEKSDKVIALITEDIASSFQSQPGLRVIHIHEFMCEVHAKKLTYTQAMLGGHKGMAEAKRSAGDENWLANEMATLIEMRKSSASRARLPGGTTPVLTEQWIGIPLKDYFNTQIKIGEAVIKVREICPSLFTTDQKKPYDLTVIIFPGIGHATAINYKTEARIFFPLLNSPGGSGDISQFDRSLTAGIAMLFWGAQTPFSGWQTNMDVLPAAYNLYCQKNKSKNPGITAPARRFSEDLTIYLFQETKGLARLDKDIREMFWRMIPYSEKLREELAKKSMVFAKLLSKFDAHYRKNKL
uniref:Uncharacterized protein n=1 Tax=candidate division CPR3 bacterium TaxID=2268181 RepID=A0A7C4R292_UNCC3